jgi:1-acyl-sn-glycerol-3-phosphate acyltransferase
MLLRRLSQIPITRGGAGAVAELEAAAEAVRSGHGVVVYPEGTTPKDGDMTPRPGKAGVARLFLATEAPVIPVVTWGPQNVFDPKTRTWNLRTRTAVTAHAGPPVDLTAWAGAPPTVANLRAITDQIMAELRYHLSTVRDERWEPSA